MVGVSVTVALVVGLTVGLSVSVRIATGVVGAVEGVEVGAGADGLKTNVARIASRRSSPIPMGTAYLRSVGGRATALVVGGATTVCSPVYPNAVNR